MRATGTLGVLHTSANEVREDDGLLDARDDNAPGRISRVTTAAQEAAPTAAAKI
jgi:hypothetical protein